MEPKKILLIEDDQSLRDLFTTKLAKHNYDLMFAADGEDGLIRAKSDQPDLIILDIVMPRMSGFELLSRIKNDPQTRGVPVFILTNLSLDADFAKGRELGADDYLIKPHLSWEDLVAKIDAQLGLKPRGGLYGDLLCQKCGEEITTQAKFCSSCGAKKAFSA